MGKKTGMNEKAMEARARKEEAKAAATAAAGKKAEDDYWDQFANPRGKKDMKKEEEQKKRAEALARKAENRRLAAEEEEAVSQPKKPQAKKITAHQLHLQSEADKRLRAQQAEEKSNELRREMTEEAYAQQVELRNENREEIAVEARSLDAALQQLSTSDASPLDRHPEKRSKAAWEDYYARMLPKMKEDKPGLKLMQYKSRIFEMWQRSPENPRNQLNSK